MTTAEEVNLEILKTLKALANKETPEEKRAREWEEARECIDRVRPGDAERDRARAEEHRIATERRIAEARRQGDPPCPFADLPPETLTPEQRWSIAYWDFPDDTMSSALRNRARAYAVPPLAPGEISAEALEDIVRFCEKELVHDEYASTNVTALWLMYQASPGAKSTKGASGDALTAAFTAGGLVPDPGERWAFQVRRRDEDSGLAFDFGEDDTDAEPIEWIVPGLIPTGCQLVLVGDQAACKTTTTAALLAAVAHGRQWLGRPTERCQCAFVNFDGRDADLRQLLRDAGAEGKVNVASYPEHNLTSDRFWEALERRFGNGKPALIAIDSLSRGSGGDVDEKDARFAAPILRAAEISSRHPITFVWLHHSPVTVRGNTINDWLRGTSALGAAFDIGFGLSKVSECASPRETIFKVETLKMRPKGVTPPAPFKLRMTDAGLALHDELQPKTPLTDDEKVLAVVRARPGLTSAELTSAVDIRGALVVEARKRLEAAGLIKNKGVSPRRSRWHEA